MYLFIRYTLYVQYIFYRVIHMYSIYNTMYVIFPGVLNQIKSIL